MTSRRIASLATLTLALFATAAHADGVAVVHGQFTDRVDHGRPVGDATALATAPSAVYWVEVNNPGAPTQVTLVWRVDGREVARQSLDVGHAPRWRTWGTRPLHGAHQVEVAVLDPAGAQIHTDHATLAGH